MCDETKKHADGIPQDIVNVVLTILGDEAGYKWLHTQLGRFEGRKVSQKLKEGSSMLSKRDTTGSRYLVASFLLGGVLHVLLRNVDFTDCFSQIFYGCVVLLWSVSISERIIGRRVRHILYGIVFFMELYFVLQICKYRLFFNNRTVWAYYYIPMLMIPILFYRLSLCMNRSEEEKPDGRWLPAALPGSFLVLMILTNNLHMLFLRIDGEGDELRIANASALYYCYWVYVIIVLAAATVILFGKCRISVSKSRIRILALTYAACVCVLPLHAAGFTPAINGVELWNIGELFVFVMICILEVCIKTGLIPANSSYRSFFRQMDIPAVIKNHKGDVVYASEGAADFAAHSADEQIQTEAIAGGSVSYMVDLASVHALDKEIEDVTEQITVRNNYLKTQNSLQEERAGVDARNRVYDRIAGIVSGQLARIDALLSENESDTVERFRRIAVYNVYIKRRSNLELLKESEECFPVSELVTAIAESVEYIRLNDVEVSFMPFAEGNCSAAAQILAYELFEVLAEVIPEQKGMMSVILKAKDGGLSQRIIANHVKLPIDEAWKREELAALGGQLCITENGEDTILALSFEKGGAQ